MQKAISIPTFTEYTCLMTLFHKKVPKRTKKEKKRETSSVGQYPASIVFHGQPPIYLTVKIRRKSNLLSANHGNRQGKRFKSRMHTQI